MNLYAIVRRNGWKTPEDLHGAAARSKKVGETEMSNDVTSPEAIQKHADRAELALSEVRAVADTVIVRPDPTR